MILLSVIVPTRNRANLLRGALESLTRQNCPLDMFEVIVVDNGSTDDTKLVCDSYATRMNFQYCYDATPGLHIGRHRGMALANADILVYADDDIEAFPTWLEAIANAFEDKDVVLVGGNNLPLFESTPPDWVNDLWYETPWGLANGHYSLIDFGDQIMEISPSFVWGCNFSIRKDVLQRIGGFHPDGMPKPLIRFRGDGESAVGLIIGARGLKTLYHPQASVHHHVSQSRMNLDYLYNRSFAQGISDSFTTIRKEGRVQTRGYLFSVLAKKIVLGVFRLRSHKGRKMEPIQRIMNKGWRDGYVYHQSQVKSDQSLLDWVMLADYLDESISAHYYDQWQMLKQHSI